MKHFANEDEALAYVMPELIDTLRDDLENMQNAEREHYEESDIEEMQNRIADLEAIAPRVRLDPAEDLSA
ncbi:hypothetical protein [Sulfitobacter pontiacus]|jgi:soluble cytochrome b562|uniref:hypothetical protein n=1 Tax=Sulfitobacter pontiacus TaxID=60137 RepID=UPI000E9040D9|nr:hypothetical protein [Sulfitobacter pontiacus]HBU55384.1 hypothetical protein [Sulfitobacter sp.]HCI98521.1 hypothetical protein [Sulfitobacter sp.]|tara:strand:+ start:4447 stop:4656 length:210 start_codon:yes stop_codon:yes gene_type:complete